MPRTNHILSLLLSVCLPVLSVFNSPPATAQSDAVESADPIEIVVGGGSVLLLAAPVDRVALADESAVRVTILTQTELLLHGLSPGRTPLFVWLENGSRKRHMINVRRDLDLLDTAITDLAQGVRAEESVDGKSILLLGNVDSAAMADGIEKRAAEILAIEGKQKPLLLNLLRYPEERVPPSAEARLEEAMKRIDPRIRSRRIQVADAEESKNDSYVLEGNVESITALRQAVTLAELQLGGIAGPVRAIDDTSVSLQRSSGRVMDNDRRTGRGNDTLGGPDNRGNSTLPGLAAQVSRGLVVASVSGRVISLLEVDQIHQILVSIRVLEIDRRKARSAGINYRVDGRHFSIGNYTRPQSTPFGDSGDQPSVSGVVGGNILGSYVSQTVSILGAIDLLESKAVARAMAEPNVLTLTGEDAFVNVGGEVPIPTTHVAEMTALQSYVFQTFGVRLSIRPSVDEDEIITLDVAPSIIRPDSGLSVGGVPGFRIQSVRTTARVKAGESLVLGGLLSSSDGVSTRKIPILGDIPLIKALFRWEGKTREERELLFVITPRLMPTAQPRLTERAPLPSLGLRDAGIGEQLVPQKLTADGLPSPWVKEARQLAEEKRLKEQAAAEAARLEAERRATEDAAKKKVSPDKPDEPDPGLPKAPGQSALPQTADPPE